MSEAANILVIWGPTGVGKTAFALAAAELLDAEILSIDSLQVYRGLDIGTAKATIEERTRVPHHLIDILDPDAEFNVADFMAAADAAVDDIVGRGKRVIAVGGTNLYARVFVHGIFDAPPPDPEIRDRHRQFAEEHGIPSLHERLRGVDPELASRLGLNDLIRISRGLEVFEQTGRKLSQLQAEHQFATPRHRALKIGLNRPRQQLYDRIDARVDTMITQGFEAEYRSLVARYPET
ncbi:MAG: tRNA (adenosine(37)-N6)-dimethylallyltransferase MiaA [bacterium]